MTSPARATGLDPAASRPAGWLPVPIPDDPAVRVVFTTRALPGDGAAANLSLLVGGGDPLAARRVALRALGSDLEHAVFMQQVHGGDIATVGPRDAGRGATDPDDAVPGVDALVTEARDLALAVLVADCVPVVLVDPHHAVGAVHAGRGGVAAGVVTTAVRRLTATPQRAVAVVGPAIGGCCYEVPAAMAAAVAREHPAAAARTTWGTPSLDLRAAVRAQLSAAGVTRVETVGGCTRCQGDTWFSHRAATAGAAPHGRQAGLVVRTAGGGDGDAAPPPSAFRPLAQSQ